VPYWSAAGHSSYQSVGDEVYQPTFNAAVVPPETIAVWTTWRPTQFSVAGAVLLDIFTCGIFGLIYYGIVHGNLPKVSRNDIGTGQAIGYSFIPYFNLYWAFRFWMGLADRVNLQTRLSGSGAPPVSRNLAMTACILALGGLIPYLGFLVVIGGFVCREIMISQVQTAINRIAAGGMGGAPGFAPVFTPPPQ
jgi:hypothetical protein